VELKRVFQCDKRTLFDAWSSPKVMAKWLFAGAEMEKPSTIVSSFTVGGSYELTMHFPGGSVSMHGIYKHINRYSDIHFSWTSPNAQDSLVELSFREMSANRTELKLKHSLFPSAQSRDEHETGWTRCLLRLEGLLAA
jgi:uncharacterized protein YndB with AHSA1/START domain